MAWGRRKRRIGTIIVIPISAGEEGRKEGRKESEENCVKEGKY